MSNKQKSFVILTPGFAANESDTTCLPSHQQFVKTLKDQFQDLHLIVIAFQYPFFKKCYTWNGVEVYSFNGGNKGKLKRLILWFKVLRRLRKIRKQKEILGILSIWCTECALVGKYFARKNSIRHKIWILGQDARADNKYIKYIRPQAWELVAMSDFLQMEFLKNHKVMPLFVIPNAIDPSLIRSQPIERNIQIMGAGSLIPLKQYDLFLSIIKQLSEKIPSVKAVLCGKGKEENNLKLILKENELDENIEMTGELEHNEILKLMGRSKVFLHTSAYEGFSSVCLEALASGAHVVSFCQPMFEEIEHWHIVETKKEMLEKTFSLLNAGEMDHRPVIPFSMSHAARKMLLLFIDQGNTAIE